MTPEIDVVAAGSPHEMGQAQGDALRMRILAARAMLAELEAFRLLRPRWMPFRLFMRSAERRARRLLESPIQAALPEATERLAGIAAGAAASLDNVYLLNGMEAFMCSLSGRIVAPPAAALASACSAIAVRGARSKGGLPLVARNFDYLPAVRPFYMLRRCRPAGGFRSLQFTMAPLAGAVDGINEHGLAIAYNYAYAIDRSPPAPTISMALDVALSSCRTVNEAAERIGAIPRSGAGLLMLADADGDLASLELSSTASQLRRPFAGEDLICHSNSYATPIMQRVEAPPHARYTNRVPRPLRGRRVLESSDRRDERLSHLLAGAPALDGDSLQEILADHGPTGTPSEATLCMHSDYWNTTACIQLSPSDRKMRVAYDSACRARFEEFEVE